MGNRGLTGVALAAVCVTAPIYSTANAGDGGLGDDFGRGDRIRHVLLISIDGMHALDFANCVSGVNGGQPYCPNLAALAQTGLTYTQASTSKPSDSFPGLISLITGASPKTTGTFYDVSYDRALSPPKLTTPYGIAGGANLCPSVVGTQIGFDEEIDYDYTKLNGGGGIDADYLPRDPNKGCAPVYPHTFIRVNTIFEVVRQAGGYTAWSDKHPSYDFANGRSGHGVDDLYTPEINSIPVALPNVPSCSPLPDQTAVSSSNSWTDSFQNIQCYDSLKVQAIINEIDGYNSTRTAQTKTPNLFGMNFQAVSVGEKLVEKTLGVTGGYLDAAGTPSVSLQGEIQYVDTQIGTMVAELKARGLYEKTAIIITAKHGQSPIDPKRLERINGDNAATNPPSYYLGSSVVQADEDDISMLWLQPRTSADVNSAVATLQANATAIGANGGEFFYGNALGLMFNTSPTDSRTPDIIVAPNVGVVYTGGQGKVAEHGGFAHDDTNVMMLISNPGYKARSIPASVQTEQVAPTALTLLGLDPKALDGVRAEGTLVLPGFENEQR